jgi:hypothetical protein
VGAARDGAPARQIAADPPAYESIRTGDRYGSAHSTLFFRWAESGKPPATVGVELDPEAPVTGYPWRGQERALTKASAESLSQGSVFALPWHVLVPL